MSQVAAEFEESEFEIQTSELGQRRTRGGRHVVIGGRPRAVFSECGMCARTRIRGRRRHSDRGYLLQTYYNIGKGFTRHGVISLHLGIPGHKVQPEG